MTPPPAVPSTRFDAGLLAEQTGIPGPTAQKLVSQLARAGLLVASRGSGGGVRLARPAAAINIAEIIEAVEGPIALTACCDEGRHDCGFEGSCQIQPHLGIVKTGGKELALELEERGYDWIESDARVQEVST